MRLKFNTTPEPSYNAKKIVTKFLWVPLMINNEIRWLEMATIKYSYDVIDSGTWEDGDDWGWVAIEFLN
jgi:hypothetical protein